MPKIMTWRPSGRTAWWVATTVVGAVLLAVASVATVNAWNIDAGLQIQFQSIPNALPAASVSAVKSTAVAAPGDASVPGRTDASPVSPVSVGEPQNILVLGVDSGAKPGASGGAGATEVSGMPGASGAAGVSGAPGADGAPGASGAPAHRGAVLALLTADALSTVTVVHIPADRTGVTVVAVPLSDGPSTANPSAASPSTASQGTAGPGAANDTIRSALASGGVAAAVRATEGLIGAPIDHVAAIDLAGFPAATTVLGGVTLQNPHAFTSGGRAFPAGRVHLSGAPALDWVRGPATTADASADPSAGAGPASAAATGVARAETQQLLLQAMMGAAVRTQTFTTLRMVSELARQMEPYVAVDENLTPAYVVNLGLKLHDINSEVTFLTVPTTDAARSAFLTSTFGAGH